MKINMAQLVANHDELKAQAKTLEASLKDVGGNGGKAAAIATEHTAVKTVASAAGADVGSEAGALLGETVGGVLGGPIGIGVGAAVGSLAGELVGGMIGDFAGTAINKKTDKFFGV